MGTAFLEFKDDIKPFSEKDYEVAYDLGKASIEAKYINTELLTEVPAELFRNYSLLSYLNLPSVSILGEAAFSRCSNLKSITINKVSTIEETDIFRDCYKLEKINIDSNVLNIGGIAYYTFYSCSSLKSLPTLNFIDNTIPYYFLAYCKNLDHLNINSGVINISNGAFTGCYNLKFISGLDLSNVIEAGNEVFWNCSNLTSNMNFSNYKMSYIPTYFFGGCIRMPFPSKLPDSVLEIKNGAFAGCLKLTEIDLNNASIIANGAFTNCSNLRSIKTLLSVVSGLTSFYGCPNMILKAPNLLSLNYGSSSTGLNVYNGSIYINEGYDLNSLEMISNITFVKGSNSPDILEFANLERAFNCNIVGFSILYADKLRFGTASSWSNTNFVHSNYNLRTLHALKFNGSTAAGYADTTGFETHTRRSYTGNYEYYKSTNLVIKDIICPRYHWDLYTDFTYHCSDKVHRSYYHDIRDYYEYSNSGLYSVVEKLGMDNLWTFLYRRSYPTSYNSQEYSWFRPISLFQKLKELHFGSDVSLSGFSDSKEPFIEDVKCSTLNTIYIYGGNGINDVFAGGNNFYLSFNFISSIFPNISSYIFNIYMSASASNRSDSWYLYDNIPNGIQINYENDIPYNIYYLSFKYTQINENFMKFISQIRSDVCIKELYLATCHGEYSTISMYSPMHMITIAGDDTNININNLYLYNNTGTIYSFYNTNEGNLLIYASNVHINNVFYPNFASSIFRMHIKTNQTIDNLYIGCSALSSIRLIRPNWGTTGLSGSIFLSNLIFSYVQNLEILESFYKFSVDTITALHCDNISIMRSVTYSSSASYYYNINKLVLSSTMKCIRLQGIDGLSTLNISMSSNIDFTESNVYISCIKSLNNVTFTAKSNFIVPTHQSMTGRFYCTSRLSNLIISANNIDINLNYFVQSSMFTISAEQVLLYAKYNITLNTNSFDYFWVYKYFLVSCNTLSKLGLPRCIRSSPLFVDLSVPHYCGSSIISYSSWGSYLIRVAPAYLSSYLSDPYYPSSKFTFITY